MKQLFLIASATLFSFGVFANDGKDFTTHKTEVLAKIETHITALQGHKTCVSAAADQAALKTCKDSMREIHMENKMDRMDKRAGNMQKRQDHMKNRIEKMKGQKAGSTTETPAEAPATTTPATTE